MRVALNRGQHWATKGSGICLAHGGLRSEGVRVMGVSVVKWFEFYGFQRRGGLGHGGFSCKGVWVFGVSLERRFGPWGIKL